MKFHRKHASLSQPVSGLLLVAGCSPLPTPDDSPGAQVQIVQQGIVSHLTEQGWKTYTLGVGLAPLSETQIIEAKGDCEGAAGSVIPPLSLEACGGAILTMPFDILEKITDAVSGTTAPVQNVSLKNAASAWVEQSNDNDCWRQR